MKSTEPPIARLHELLVCDPGAGIVRWRVGRGGQRAGEIAGSVHKSDGYRYIRIDRILILEHRIVYAMTDGAWPPQLIDHINGNKADNRRKNLRPVTYAENCHNRKRNSNNTSGTTGVRKVENGKFEAYIYVNGKKIHLGYFATKKEAEDARDDAKRKYHPSASWTRIAADAGLSLWKGI